MPTNKKIGLTLGKYAPFHVGHALVIETALVEMDEVIVMVYNASQTTSIPTHVRSDWIKQTFPRVTILIAEDGPQDTGYTQAIINLQNNYIRKKLADFFANQNSMCRFVCSDSIEKTRNKPPKISAFYSSEPYGAYVSEALGCDNRAVDISRLNHPISATQLRLRPDLTTTYCPPVVCQQLKPRFYFMGAPSTGKTTLSKYAATQLEASYCREYGREYWFAHQKNHRLSMLDLETIAAKQQALEQQACQTPHDMVCIDTNIMTTYAFARYYFGEVSAELTRLLLADLYRYQSPHLAKEHQPSWQNQHVFLCDDDIAFEDTWDRSGGGSRDALQAINKQVLDEFNVNYTLVSGSIESRFQQIQQHIQEKVLWGFSTVHSAAY